MGKVAIQIDFDGKVAIQIDFDGKVAIQINFDGQSRDFDGQSSYTGRL